MFEVFIFVTEKKIRENKIREKKIREKKIREIKIREIKITNYYTCFFVKSKIGGKHHKSYFSSMPDFK